MGEKILSCRNPFCSSTEMPLSGSPAAAVESAILIFCSHFKVETLQDLPFSFPFSPFKFNVAVFSDPFASDAEAAHHFLQRFK